MLYTMLSVVMLNFAFFIVMLCPYVQCRYAEC